MPKALSIAGLVVAGLLVLVFAVDLILGLAGVTWLAPFMGADWMVDVVFVICAGVLGYLSWNALKEQV